MPMERSGTVVRARDESQIDAAVQQGRENLGEPRTQPQVERPSGIEFSHALLQDEGCGVAARPGRSEGAEDEFPVAHGSGEPVLRCGVVLHEQARRSHVVYPRRTAISAATRSSASRSRRRSRMRAAFQLTKAPVLVIW